MVHAPHCAMPHPYFVPVGPGWSRMTHNSGVEGSTSRSMCLPFTEKAIIILSCLSSLLSYAVCIGLLRGDRFSLCKLSSGTFAGYFSAIELVSGRRIFGTYCAPASLLGCSETPAF